MTLEELDANYRAANWLIAKRSAVAAGKALIFNENNLNEAAGEIAAIYGLNDEETGRLQPSTASNAFGQVQMAANGLLGPAMGLSTGQALTVAQDAVANGQKIKALKTFLQAGPIAAKVAATGAKVAGNTAGKTTPWGWIATAAYAAGTGSWFAYNLHAFNLAAYELVRLRENIPLPPEPPNDDGRPLADVVESTRSAMATRVGAVGARAESVWDGAVEKGAGVAATAGNIIHKIGTRWKRTPDDPNV